MNILYYCDEYPPCRNGGIGTVVKLVAEKMVTRGHHVVVVGDYTTMIDNQTVDEYSFVNGVHVYRLIRKEQKKDFLLKLLKRIDFLLRRKFSIIQFLIAKRKVRIKESYVKEVIRKHRIELLELPDYQEETFHGLTKSMLFEKYNIPTLIRVHGACSFLQYHRNGYIENQILKNDANHFERADAVCAVSKFAAEFVQKTFNYKEVEVIYNPIDDELFNNVVENNLDADTILFFGKIIETKGAFNLIKAFNLIADKYPNIKLKLIGGGDVITAKSLIEEKYKDRVLFEKHLPKEKVIEEIDKSLFCVLPSYFENFSMAALEVLARKRALIYTERASGKELIINGKNGMLVDPDNIQQIAEKIAFLLDNPKQREEIALKGFVSCKERFSTEIILPKLEDYYQTLISKNEK